MLAFHSYRTSMQGASIDQAKKGFGKSLLNYQLIKQSSTPFVMPHQKPILLKPLSSLNIFFWSKALDTYKHRLSR